MNPADRRRNVDWMCIGIEKVAETDETVDYDFVSDVSELPEGRRSRWVRVGENRGTLRIDKVTGEVVLLVAMPEDDGKRFLRAAARIRKHWAAGEFPYRTMFACG